MIGSGRADQSIEERSADILLALNVQNDSGIHIDAQQQAKIENVRKCLVAWQNIKKEFKEFFETKPLEFGLQLTNKGIQIRQAFFEGEKSHTAIIEDFVNSFDGLSGKSKSHQLEQLREFWTAADKMHETLSNMTLKMDSDEFFDGCFEFKE